MSFLNVSFKEPGYVTAEYTETDNILKAKALPQTEISHDISMNHQVAPTFGSLSPKASGVKFTSPPLKSLTEHNACLDNDPSQDALPEISDRVDSEGNEVEDHDRTGEVSGSPDLPGNVKSTPPLIIERRYCTACKLEQPLRAKHCRVCKRCVALHDHHCPWLGICIGERNRRNFYWYLVAQTIELWWAIIRVCYLFQSEPSIVLWMEVNFLFLVQIVVMAFFTSMLTSLLLFHSYLACSNRTTCNLYTGEHVSWEKISYLRDWPIEFGSPFSRGCLPNLYMYCLAKAPLPYRVWEVPQEFPEYPPKDCLLC